MPLYRQMFPDGDVRFITSAARLDQCDDHAGVEFALFGRSNVGKSSFLNHIFEKKSLVKVSREPGKTRLINFFRINDDITFVDLPGYGYARVSKTDRRIWSQMMDDYLRSREQLAGVIWLLDYRRGAGTAIDIEAANFLSELGLPLFVVLTKEDKLNRTERMKNRSSLEKVYRFPDGMPVIAYSTTDSTGRERFWKRFHTWITEE
ncbi:MAG: ribosome biogenesis GTP-binding protein YihA/YsxC [Fibrobacterota bacterium]